VTQDLLIYAPEVAEARANGTAIVALESTIITHGMPFPQNVEAARAVEAEVRRAGATPATIAVTGGKILIGLTDAQLDALGRAEQVMKLSRADLAACLVQGKTGATTVAATMICAHMAGIDVFATGGIGGVHRGAETSFDISADLPELGDTPVTVIAAGAKAILDLPKTLEYLETKGVPVLGYKTEDFPAFWARTSGYKVDRGYQSAADVAAVLDTQFSLGMGGVLIANPIPESHALDAAEMESWIDAALRGAEQEGVARNKLTPFLLKRIFELTEGRSLVANIALVEHNALVASEVAIALAARRK